MSQAKMAKDHSTEWWGGCPRCQDHTLRTRRVMIEFPNIVVGMTCLNPDCEATFLEVYAPLYKVVTDGT